MCRRPGRAMAMCSHRRSPARASRRSRPRTFPISNARQRSPTPCWSFCCRNLPPTGSMRYRGAPVRSWRRARRSRDCEHHRLYARISGVDHPLRLGTVWTRPGLDPRVRRLLVLAATASLGRWEEFRLHVRTGFAAGIGNGGPGKEVLLQVAVYAGVPAANTGFHIAAEELSQ